MSDSAPGQMAQKALTLIETHIEECTEQRRQTKDAIKSVNETLSNYNRVAWGFVATLAAGLLIAGANFGLSYVKADHAEAAATAAKDQVQQASLDRDARDKQIIALLLSMQRTQGKDHRHGS